MGSNGKSVVDMIETSSEVHFSGFHMNGGLDPRNSEVEQPTTSAAEHAPMQPFVIGKWHMRSFLIFLMVFEEKYHFTSVSK